MKHRLSVLLILMSISLQAQNFDWLVKPIYECEGISSRHKKFKGQFWVKYNDRTYDLRNTNDDVLISRDTLKWLKIGPEEKIATFYLGDDLQIYNDEVKCLSCDYDEVIYEQGFNVLTTKLNGNYGMIDFNGKILIPSKYKSIKRLTNSKIEVVKENGKNKIKNIPPNESSLFFRQFKYINNTIQEEFVLNNKNKQADKSVRILSDKKDLLERHAYYFRDKFFFYKPDSLIIVEEAKTNLLGIIDTDGRVRMKPSATNISRTHISNLFEVEIGSKKGLYNAIKNELIFHDEYNLFVLNEDFLFSKKDSKNGLLTLEQREIFAPTYDDLYEKSGNIYLKKDSKYFIYSAAKDSLSSDYFDRIYAGKENVVRVQKGLNFSLYDASKFEYLLDTVYSNIKPASEKYYVGTEKILSKKRSKVKTYNGQIEKKPTVTHRYTYFNHEGKTVNGPYKRRLKKLKGDYFVYSDSIPKVINILTNTSFEIATNEFKVEDEVLILDDEYYYFLDDFIEKKGSITPYRKLKEYEKPDIYVYQENEKYGFTTKIKKITQPLFDKILIDAENQFSVKLEGKWGLIKLNL